MASNVLSNTDVEALHAEAQALKTYLLKEKENLSDNNCKYSVVGCCFLTKEYRFAV